MSKCQRDPSLLGLVVLTALVSIAAECAVIRACKMIAALVLEAVS